MALDIGAVFKIKAGVEGTDQVRRLNQELKRTEDQSGSLGKALGAMKGAIVGAFSAAALLEFKRQAVDAAMQAEQASARLTATLRATGYSAGLTKKELDDLADSMAASTQFDDESVRNAGAALLKFGNIQKGVFEEGIKLSADLAALMGTDIVDAAQTVGKALSSPTEGIGALERQTGKFTQAQKDAIKAMADSGDVAGAQSRILEILRGKIGGVAEEMNTGLTKKTNDLKKAWDEMLESFGKTRLISGDKDGGGFMGFLKQSLIDIKKILDEGDWWDKLKAVGKFSLGFRGFDVGDPNAGSRVSSGQIKGLGNTEEEKAAAGAAAERQRQAAEAAAAKRAEYLKVQADQYKSIKQQMEGTLAKSGEMTISEETLRELQTSRYDHLTKEQKNEILRMAALATYRKQAAEDEKAMQEERDRQSKQDADNARKESEHIADLVAEYKDLADPAEKYRKKLEEITQLWLQGRLTDDEMSGASAAIREKIDDLNTYGKAAKDTMDELRQAIEGWGRAASQAFTDWAFGAQGSIKDVAATWMKEIANMMLYANVFKPLANSAGDWLSSVIPGLIGSFGGGGGAMNGSGLKMRAFGGPVTAGHPYIVGERGPELMVPNSSGRIVPNGAAAGMSINMPITINQTNQGDGGQDPRMLAAMVGAKVREVMVEESRSGGMLAGLRG